MTASNGEPVAIRARPPVQARTSAGVASACDVGLDSGITNGRSAGPTRSSIASMTSWVNVPATPVVPTRTVGRCRAIVSSRSASGRPPPARPARVFVGIEVRAARMDEPVRIDQRDRLADMRLRQARVEHREPQQPRDADPRRAGPDEHDPGVGQRPAGGAQPASTPATTTAAVPWMSSLNDGTRCWYRSSSAQRVLLLEVLELDEGARPDLLDAGDERLHERVVGRAAQPRRAMAEVERVGEQRRVVRADIERDRQGERRVDAAGRRVQRELADRDGHAARALVAQAQDPLVVGHDDQPHVLVRALAQDLRERGRRRRG